MAKAHFVVFGYFDTANKVQRAILTVDRDSGLASVRLHRRRDVQEVPLATVAELIYTRSAQMKKNEQAAAKKPRKRKVSRGLLTVR